MSYYIEDPIGRIVDVHWKKKKDDEPPPDPGYPPAYCGRYGYGSKMDLAPSGIITALPYGPNQFPPFVGTFRTDGNTGADGTQYGRISTPMRDPVPTLTAGQGLHAGGVVLNATALDFSNNQLAGIPNDFGGTGVNWSVPMVGGYEGRVPRVIESYDINFEWVNVQPGIAADEFGIGISHPKSGTFTAKPPPQPFMSGLQSGGTISFVYDFKWLEWAKGEIVVTDANQFDPTLGGPALLWAMTRRKIGASYQPWGSYGYFMGPMIGLGDWYTWEIIAACQPQPPLF